MANSINHVFTGKPKATGGIWWAPKGTALPTDAKTTLAAAYKCLGYVSEDGISKSIERESEEIKAWGGDTVLTPTTGVTYTFGFTLIEADNTEVLKFIYGEDHVTAGDDGEFDVYATAEDLEEHVFIIETMNRAGDPMRYIIPLGKLTENGETTLTDSEAVGYEVTITAMPYDEDGYNGASFRYLNK